MRGIRLLGWLALAGLLMAPTKSQPAYPPMPVLEQPAAIAGSGLSIMTYNVKGLPWPVASGREPALAEIGSRLAEMRRTGTQPGIVLLQEAFTDDAKAIGRRSGYRYVAYGPSSAPTRSTPPLGAAYAAAARRDRGENLGVVLDSGLAIFSDYPIVASREIAFPQGACAGFDCLAAKGVLIAWIEVPGIDRPIAVANTHLNSRHATHVDLARADAANAWQIEQVERAIADEVSPETPVIFGGDFNIGNVGARQDAFAHFAPLGSRQHNALAILLARNEPSLAAIPEAAAVAERNKDMLLFRNGLHVSDQLHPNSAVFPFPLSLGHQPLSDHSAIMVNFRIARAVASEPSGSSDT